jgi:hypothetical protein
MGAARQGENRAAVRRNPQAGKLKSVELSLRAIAVSDTSTRNSKLQEFIDSEVATLDKGSPVDRAESLFHILFAAYIAATDSNRKLAVATLSHQAFKIPLDEYPILDRIRAATSGNCTCGR